MRPKTFIVRNTEIAQRVYDFIGAHADDQIKLGKPLRVVIAPYVEDRTLAQNAFMWSAVLTQIARQVVVLGRRHPEESWNEHLKEKFLPEECSKGVKKWRYLPTGERRLHMSTTDLDVQEMSIYLEQIQAYAATELGVEFRNKHESAEH